MGMSRGQRSGLGGGQSRSGARRTRGPPEKQRASKLGLLALPAYSCFGAGQVVRTACLPGWLVTALCQRRYSGFPLLEIWNLVFPSSSNITICAPVSPLFFAHAPTAYSSLTGIIGITSSQPFLGITSR
jgi:hypothetical protein